MNEDDERFLGRACKLFSVLWHWDDAATNAQRGAPFLRDDGNGVDIGAYELQTLDPSFFVVSKFTDELDHHNVNVSLREAIYSANGSTGADAIMFDPAVFTGGTASLIRLNGTELKIVDTLTSDGTTGVGVTITGDANADDLLIGDSPITDAINNGNIADNSRLLNFSRTIGDMTLEGLTLTGGRTTNSGGGIRFNSSGALTLMNSMVSGNRSKRNGGGVSTYSGHLNMTSSTLSGNISYSSGGGIYTQSGNLSLVNSTLSGNTAAGAGGGVFVYDSTANPTFTIENSIVAANTDNGTAADLKPDPDSTLTINHSLIGAAGITIGGLGNQAGSIGNPLNPLLGSLADNGGLTLLPGSPALNAGASTATTDQRGLARDNGHGVDMNAYEAQINPFADFDNDGNVDGFEFLSWQRGFGSANAQRADGNSDDDRDVDASGLAAWQVSYGQIDIPMVAASAEPSSPTLVEKAASTELFDAAQAFAAIEHESGERLATVAAPLVADPVITDAAFAAYDPLKDLVLALNAIEDFQLSQAAASEAELSKQPWLSDEFMELVFG